MKVNLEDKVAQFEAEYEQKRQEFAKESNHEKVLDVFCRVHQTKKDYDSSITSLTQSLEHWRSTKVSAKNSYFDSKEIECDRNSTKFWHKSAKRIDSIINIILAIGVVGISCCFLGALSTLVFPVAVAISIVVVAGVAIESTLIGSGVFSYVLPERMRLRRAATSENFKKFVEVFVQNKPDFYLQRKDLKDSELHELYREYKATVLRL